MAYLAGAGFKKPLNMLETPIYPDIKKTIPRFQWSGKHWNVDTAKVMLEQEGNEQLLADSILAQNRDYGRDQYGHSSYQEKITVFRPPLISAYEDNMPLNRLPTKIYAIQPRINPGTAHGQGGSAYEANNSSVPEISKYITDRIATNQWRETFFAPMSGPEDGNTVQPDLVYTIPQHAVSSGYTTQVTKDAYDPRSDYVSDIEKLTTSASAGYTSNYDMPLSQQTTSSLPGGELLSNVPEYSTSAGYSAPYTVNGTIIENFELERKTPNYSMSSGYAAPFSVDGEMNTEYELQRKTPATPVSSGYTSANTVNGETRLDELVFSSKLSAPNVVANPGSETGFQTRLDSYTSPEQHMKLRENPKVSASAQHNSEYRELNSMTKNFHVRTKTEPVKFYGHGLDKGTILTNNVPSHPVKLKHESMKNKKTYNGASSTLRKK